MIWSYGDDPASGDEAGEKIDDETSAGEHFAVMLDYMSEQEEFLELMETDEVYGIYTMEYN